MSDLISSIGTFLSSGAGNALLKGGIAGGGFLQNWLANRQAEQKQKFIQNLIQNPAKFAAFVNSFNQPLQAGLTQNVAREADAYGAERGLGSSGPIMKDVYAQALAPYLLQQQNQAEQTALSSLGIYEGSPTTRPVDLTSILKMFQSQPPSSGISDSFIDLAPPATVPSSVFNTQVPPIAPLPSPSITAGGGGFDPTTMENYQ